MDDEVSTLQGEIVQAIVAIIPCWERIVLNYEVVHGNGDPDTGCCFFHVTRAEDGTFAMDSELPLPDHVEALLMQMNDLMLAMAGSRWGICDLVIDADGRYRFAFDYGPAKRLNGVLDHASHYRFNNYLAPYADERDATRRK